MQVRRTFELATDAAVPAHVPLRVSADSRYVLWVNDAVVGRGPIRSQPRRLRYDEYDIADLLRPGYNVIAVLVTYYGQANSFWQPAAASGVMGRDAQLVLEARLDDAEDGWLVTDAEWRVVRSSAWRSPESGKALDGVPVELLDARELDPAWTSLDFDDSTWNHAALVKLSHDGGLAESRPPVDPAPATSCAATPTSTRPSRSTACGGSSCSSLPPLGDEADVTVRGVAVSEYHYPFTGGASFSSSDPELNRLYQAGIRTTELNSFDSFTDCPTRE